VYQAWVGAEGGLTSHQHRIHENEQGAVNEQGVVSEEDLH
jgi:hypothetical protein